MRLARADPWIQKDRGDMKFPLQLAFNGPDPEVGVERLQIRHEDHRVTLPLRGSRTASSRAGSAPRARALAKASDRLVPCQGALRSAVSQIRRNGACPNSSAMASAMEDVHVPPLVAQPGNPRGELAFHLKNLLWRKHQVVNRFKTRARTLGHAESASGVPQSYL